MERLTTKELAPYLPYGLTVRNGVDYTLIGIMPYRTFNKYNGEDEFRLIVKSEDNAMDEFPLSDQCSILLRPLSQLTEEINWGNQTYAITDLFEIGDDGGFIYEYDHGNIKLISQLKTIAEYNYHHDINYLPYPVVQVLIEHHFDVFGLIDRGLALTIDGKEVEGE